MSHIRSLSILCMSHTALSMNENFSAGWIFRWFSHNTSFLHAPDSSFFLWLHHREREEKEGSRDRRLGLCRCICMDIHRCIYRWIHRCVCMSTCVCIEWMCGGSCLPCMCECMCRKEKWERRSSKEKETDLFYEDDRQAEIVCDPTLLISLIERKRKNGDCPLNFLRVCERERKRKRYPQYLLTFSWKWRSSFYQRAPLRFFHREEIRRDDDEEEQKVEETSPRGCLPFFLPLEWEATLKLPS